MLSNVEEIKNGLLNDEYLDKDIYLSYNGRPITVEELGNLSEYAVIRVYERLYGGKGGFGSMLRAIGSQIEKTTNHEMCRDLTGRRMRDVNAEKKLREWYEKATDREREKAKLYIERRKKRQQILEEGPLPNHKFEDPKFMRQKEKITTDLQDAIESNILTYKAIYINFSLDPTAVHKVIAKQIHAKETKKMEQQKCKTWLEKYDEIEVSSSEESDQAEGDKENEITQDFLVDKLESIIANFDENEASSSEDVVIEEGNQVAEPVLSEETESRAEKRKAPLETDPLSEEKKKKVIEAPPLTEDEIKSAETPKDLESYSLEALKSTLTARGVKCGGSLSERAQRLFLIRDLKPDQYPKNLLAKGPKNAPP
ncbi:silencing defective protein Sde2 [Cichlidogyrus casuarinus]|uniref:Silencing defective protein Sde2 n=1 Tax=Cichlidogyrus casuarinus TaxID=1844966 RepID=A0ABD2PMZ2_9PLAT